MKQYDNKEIVALICGTLVAIVDIFVEQALTPAAAAIIMGAMGYVFGREKG